MDHLLISQIESINECFEVVERKWLGHPDTICDALAEALSRTLCREYRQHFGEILHHNVDKALLSGGSAAPAFDGGSVIAPINIYLAGRAIAEVGSRRGGRRGSRTRASEMRQVRGRHSGSAWRGSSSHS